jgi:beta-N-acetylhexosaminidase
MKRFLKPSFLVSLLLISHVSFAALPACNTIINQAICNKIGQMLIVGFGGNLQTDRAKTLYDDPDGTVFKTNSRVAKTIKNDHIGGVILFSQPIMNVKTGEMIRQRNIENPKQVAALNQSLQAYNTQTRQKQGLSRLPLVISIDEEGGEIDRLPATLGFINKTQIPQSFGALAKNNLPRAKKEAAAFATLIAKELKSLHFNVNFAPVVDVNVNPTNPIIGARGRSLSANPKWVSAIALAQIKAYKANGILPVIKHFPGHGSSTADSHLGLVDVTKTYQKQKELYPYRELIKKHFGGLIMTTHVINGQIDRTQCRRGPKSDPQTWCPGTLSYQTLTKLLRKKLHYHGVIISDDMTMKAIEGQYPLKDTLANGINAGIDMIIISNNQADQTQKIIDTIAMLVKNGHIPRATINTAFKRIVKMKRRLGPS